MSRSETQDGTYYYVETEVRRQGGFPPLLRTQIKAGIPHDGIWHVDTDTWAPTEKLFKYRLNMDENEIRPVTERLAHEIQEREMQWWSARSSATNQPRPENDDVRRPD